MGPDVVRVMYNVQSHKHSSFADLLQAEFYSGQQIMLISEWTCNIRNFIPTFANVGNRIRIVSYIDRMTLCCNELLCTMYQYMPYIQQTDTFLICLMQMHQTETNV